MDKIFIKQDLSKLKAELSFWNRGIFHESIVFNTDEYKLRDFLAGNEEYFKCTKGMIVLRLLVTDDKLRWFIGGYYYDVAEMEFVDELP